MGSVPAWPLLGDAALLQIVVVKAARVYLPNDYALWHFEKAAAICPRHT